MQPLRHYDRHEFLRFVGRYDQATLESWLDELLQCHDSSGFAAPGYAPLLARTISERIASGRPTSCLRLGDGEGNVLAAFDAEFRNLHRLSANTIAEMHLGRWYPASAVEFWSRSMSDAVVHADVIGVPCRERIAWTFRHIRNAGQLGAIDIRGTCGTINALRMAHVLLSEPRPGRIITNCWYHRDLLPHYGELLQGLPRITLISCHSDLPQRLQRAFGIGRVDYLQVPAQASKASRQPAQAHYPARFVAVLEALRSLRKGELVLVAAGFLGKIYCERIRSAGGIALDIGSAADVWMAMRTRRSHTEALVQRWKL